MQYIRVRKSPPLRGVTQVSGAKNATLPIMAACLLSKGVSQLRNVPFLSDTYTMIAVLRHLGASVFCDEAAETVMIDTNSIQAVDVPLALMQQMRASILVMGPLLVRCGTTEVAMPGGCSLGARPIDLHLYAFNRLGAQTQRCNDSVCATCVQPQGSQIVLDYPSVGATENALMCAAGIPEQTTIINAALEPEVWDLITVLQKMGATVNCEAPATIHIHGATDLHPVDHTIMPDRLETGTLLCAAAATGGSITISNAPVASLAVVLEKLREMGHAIEELSAGGVKFTATDQPHAVSFKTMPYPGFPTDLQAPMMAALTGAIGISEIHETVYENRLTHVPELQCMGARITTHGTFASVHGPVALSGARVEAPNIRGAAALIIAGLIAEGETSVTGIHHVLRGHVALDMKLRALGASIELCEQEHLVTDCYSDQQAPVL